MSKRNNAIMPPRYFIGLDLGQAQDFTALAVLSRPEVFPWEPPSARRPPYLLPHLERFPPGTPYPEVVRRVVALLQTPPLPGSVLVVDGTGVGSAVVAMLVEGLCGRADCTILPLTVGSGQGATMSDAGGLCVPRKELAGTLQVLLQTRRLQFAPALPHAPLLVKELRNFRAKAPGADDPAGWREGANDDLVLAVALAAWVGEQALPPLYDPPEESTITRLLV